MIRLHLLGAIELRHDDGRELGAVLTQPKRVALLAYLAAACPPGPRRRDTLLGLFWPELDQEHARNALNKAVYFLRRSLGEAALISRGDDELTINEAMLWVDVRAFGSALDAERTREALELYRGDLLPGFFISAAPEFERWLEGERARLRFRAAEAARRMAEGHEAAGQFAEAMDRTRQAVELSDGDERLLRRLIELLDRLGDRAGALRAYDSFARRIAVELEAEPAPETVALIHRVRTSRLQSTPVTGLAVRETRRSALDEMPSPMPAAAPRAGSVDVRYAAGWWRRRARLVAAIAGCCVLATLATIRFFGRSAAPGLDANLVAIAPFDVLDPTLAIWREGIVDVLSRDLDGAGPLRTVPATLTIRGWRGRAEAEAARELGRRTGAGVVVFGHVIPGAANTTRIGATLKEVGSGRTLGEVEIRKSTSDMGGLLESLTLGLLEELGRSRPIGAVRRAPINARSLPALKAFLRGEQFYRRMSWDSALAQFDHAIALDSGFALAHYRMAQTRAWSPDNSPHYLSFEEYARRAGILNRGQTKRDSLLLVGLSSDPFMDPYHPAFFARLRQSRAALEAASSLYPGDPEVWLMSGEARYHHYWTHYPALREPLDAFDRAIKLDSAFGPPYKHTVGLALALGDPDRARQYAAAYLASVPRDVPASNLHLEALLLDPAGRASTQAAQLIATLPTEELWLATFDLAHWPDPEETSVRLASALLQAPRSSIPRDDSISRRAILARMLAFRGHLREAHRTVPPDHWSTVWQHPFPDLALIGAVPSDSASVLFGRVLRSDQLWPSEQGRLALAWWNRAGDTASLVWFARRADSAANHHPNPVAREHLGGLADAARAYLSLVKRDSLDALRAFAALPDSLCILFDCFFEKLTQSKLAAALGQDRKAAEIFDRWIPGRHLSPVGVLGALERGGIAERLGQRDMAMKSYRFVMDAWRHADPELQHYVAEAREGLVRVATLASDIPDEGER